MKHIAEANGVVKVKPLMGLLAPLIPIPIPILTSPVCHSLRFMSDRATETLLKTSMRSLQLGGFHFSP